MAEWGGFSEADLHRLKKDHLKSDELEVKAEQTIRKVNFNTGNKRQRPREKIKPKLSAPKATINNKQRTVVEKTATDTSSVELNLKPECERSLTSEKSKETSKPKNCVVEENGSNNEVEEEKVPDIISEPERIQAIELTALQKMQQKQKEIEDQNKKKKAALQETIRTRFKKTQAEANTLKAVHKELARLDNLLSADVAVLRDTIEEATRDYHYALKRYDQAEAEFVTAKMDLHKKTERKEMLTEHLLTIIQQNEERKAKKLEELMAKLELSEDMIDEESLKQHIATQENYEESEKNGNEMGYKKTEMEEKQLNSERMVKANGDGKVTESKNTIEQEKVRLNGSGEVEDKNEITEVNNSKVKEEKEQCNKHNICEVEEGTKQSNENMKVISRNQSVMT